MSAAAGSSTIDEEGIPVILPSGATFPVLTDSEVEYLNDRADRYLSQNHFVNVSDLQDVDRLLILELLAYRHGVYLSRGRNYFGDVVDDKDLRSSLDRASREIRQVKDQLGIDKKNRDRTRGEDSVPVYIENLLNRAREFGVMREAQLDKALELIMTLQAQLTLFDNCDDTERRELDLSEHGIVQWVRDVLVPEFNEIDAYFREHHQRTWIAQQ